MRKPSVFKRVTKDLLSIIEQHRKRGEDRLPTIKEMAVDLKCSSQTLWKAVHALTEKGILDARPHRGLTILSLENIRKEVEDKRHSNLVSDGDHTIAGSRGNKKQLKWEALREHIERDVLTGALLPRSTSSVSYKELKLRYGVCHTTLRKAVDALLDNGLVRPFKKGIAPASRKRNPEHGNTIVLLVHDHLVSALPVVWRGHADNVVRIIDAACIQANANLHITTWTRSYDGVHVMAERDSGKFKDEAFRNRILGFVLWARSLDKDFREDTLRWLAGMKKPIAVMYEDTAQRYDVPGVPKGLVRTYETTQNPTSGLLVGRHLIALGHRKIAYVSIAHDNDWSTSRLRGLRKAFAAAGITGAVKTWVNTKHSTEYRIEDFESFAGIKLPTPSEAEALADTSVGANENALVSYKRLLHHFMTDANVFMLLQHVGRNVVDEILAQGDITAIVTATDFLGLACMSALKERKVAVPKQISVIGFDNSVEGCGLGLSSYDFNVESMVNAAVDFVLKTPWSRSRSYRPVETEGVVVQRESTGPAPRQPLGYNACIS